MTHAIACSKDRRLPWLRHRDGDNFVMVKYDKHMMTIPRSEYVANGYKPPYDELPTHNLYNDEERKKAVDALRKEASKTPQER
jgi:hypothetical protein